MVNSFKKRGQKFLRRFSRASLKASEEGKEHIKENLIGRISHIENIRLLIFEWVLLVTALIMLSVAQAFWFGDSYAETAFTTGGTYSEATIGEVNSLNPLFATTNSEKVLSKLMFATITTVDYSGHLGLGLAKSVTPSEDGQRWTVRLKDDLKWSDGEAITNADVTFTTSLIKNPAVSSIYSSNLSSVKVYESEDGAIVFDLPTPYADFISALNFPVVPKHILGESDVKTLVENSFSTDPVTSGAFTFNAVQTAAGGERIFYLSSSPYYYGGKPLINSFAVHVFNTKDDIIDAINAGSVTATAELSGPEVDKIKASNYIRRNASLNAGAFMFFNLSSANVKDAALRNAIRQGINLDEIRAAAPDTTPLDYPLLKTQIDLTRYAELPTQDVEAARAKINELAGDSKLHLEIATVQSGYLPEVAEVVKNELTELGFEVNVSVYEENQDFISSIVSRRNYDILIYEVELGADPDLLPYYHSSQTSTSGLNLSNFKNSLVDDLLLGARNTLDTELRIKKYESFIDLWVSNVPAIALYQPNLTYFYNKNVRPFGNDVKLVTAIDRFSDISNWAVNKTTKNKTP